ncbi:ER-resident thioredoxin [Xylariaceae sp. FL0016]|nr:ER-resident thioredoxin [Xylariaceae sp. FL0016]
MKINHLGFTAVSLLRVASAWKHTGEQEFRRAVAGHNQALVAFVEPSIATCQTLEAEWAPLAETDEGLMSINCADEHKLCDEFGVISYPALRYFDGHGSSWPYRGPRKASAIRAFLKRAGRPSVTKLNEKKMATFPSIDETVFLAHVNPRDEHIEAGYKAIASQYRDRASFGATETSGSSNIVCYNNQDEQQLTISDLTAIETMPNFIQKCLEPLIGEFTRANEMKYLQAGKSLVFYFAGTAREREAFVGMMRPVAKMYNEYLNFVTVDANEYADLAVPLGLVPDSFPALSVQNPMFGQVFPYPTDAKIVPETVGGFVMDIVQGKVKPWDGQVRGRRQGSHDEL